MSSEANVSSRLLSPLLIWPFYLGRLQILTAQKWKSSTCIMSPWTMLVNTHAWQGIPLACLTSLLGLLCFQVRVRWALFRLVRPALFLFQSSHPTTGTYCKSCTCTISYNGSTCDNMSTIYIYVCVFIFSLFFFLPDFIAKDTVKH